MKIDWKAKLTSRKFWAAIAGFVTAILVACNASSMTIEQVVSVITAGGVLIAYILGESMVDKARAENPVVDDQEEVETRMIGFKDGEE